MFAPSNAQAPSPNLHAPPPNAQAPPTTRHFLPIRRPVERRWRLLRKHWQRILWKQISGVESNWYTRVRKGCVVVCGASCITLINWKVLDLAHPSINPQLILIKSRPVFQRSRTHSLTNPLIHSLSHSLTHSSTHSATHSRPTIQVSVTERSGYLYKKCSSRSRHMGWAKKWVVFRDGYLRYYSDEKVFTYYFICVQLSSIVKTLIRHYILSFFIDFFCLTYYFIYI